MQREDDGAQVLQAHHRHVAVDPRDLGAESTLGQRAGPTGHGLAATAQMGCGGQAPLPALHAASNAQESAPLTEDGAAGRFPTGPEMGKHVGPTCPGHAPACPCPVPCAGSLEQRCALPPASSAPPSAQPGRGRLADGSGPWPDAAGTGTRWSRAALSCRRCPTCWAGRQDTVSWPETTPGGRTSPRGARLRWGWLHGERHSRQARVGTLIASREEGTLLLAQQRLRAWTTESQGPGLQVPSHRANTRTPGLCFLGHWLVVQLGRGAGG